MHKPTIYEALQAKLGRTPTNAEIKADVQCDLSHKHPLEIEAEQLGALAAWCDLEALVTDDFFAYVDLMGTAYLCRNKQLALLLSVLER